MKKRLRLLSEELLRSPSRGKSKSHREVKPCGFVFFARGQKMAVEARYELPTHLSPFYAQNPSLKNG